MVNVFNFIGKQFEFDNNFITEPIKLENVLLYQAGELACVGDLSFQPHVQICHEISYIISGKGKMVADNIVSLVQAGDIHVVAKGQNHALYSDPENPLRYAYLAFELTNLENDNVAMVLDNFFLNNENPVVKDKFNIDVLFTAFINEFYRSGVFTSFMKISYVKQILILTYRNFIEDLNKSFYLRINDNQSVGNTVYSIIRYVDDHIYEPFSIKDIADRLGYSYGHISRLFKLKTGKTLQDYITMQKMNEAAKLIKEGRLTITQISEKINYETIQSFSKAFNKAMGCSPSSYAKLFK